MSIRTFRDDADKWHVLALAAQSAVQGLRPYADLRNLIATVDGARVLGALSSDNACVRLKRLALKAAYAPRPEGYEHGLTEAAGQVVELFAQAFGQD